MRQATGELAKATLGQVCRLVTDGTHDTPKRVDHGYPLIKAKEIVGGQIDFDSCDQISEAEHLKVISRSKPEAGDTLFAHIGASLGEAAYVGTSREFSIKNIALFKPNPAIVVPRYLYYLVVSPDFQALAKGSRTGSAQPFLSLGHLRSHPVRYHQDLTVQRRIASILSAYDDLIENNTRRIAILEEMARRIYEEWFVRFRFPGHEGVRMVESELGLVPEGWRPCPVTDVAIFKYGKGLPTKHLADDGPFPVYGASKIIGRYTEYTREGRTLIVGCRGSVGVPQITLPRCFVTNNSFTADPLRSTGLLWLYLVLQHRGLTDVVGGSAQPQITLEALSGATVLSPPGSLIDNFDVAVRPMYELAWTLIDKNTNLRSTRDLLLPKLISGELDVSALPEPEPLAA